MQDYTLGWAMHLPTLIGNNTDIFEGEVNLELMMGPNVAITGEVMWGWTPAQKTN